MRSTNRKRALITSGAVILLALTVIVGTTFALFTDTVEVENHLQAGDLNITLKRTNLVTNSVDPNTGYLVPATNETVEDFSEPTGKNVFDLTKDSKIVPCSTYTATMEISNSKTTSDVAYAYWLEVKLIYPDGMTEEEKTALKLDEQLKITVVSEAGTVSKTLDEGLTVGSEASPIGTLALAESDEFTVTMEFVDSASNNSAKRQNLQFDLIVHAVQVTKAPTS